MGVKGRGYFARKQIRAGQLVLLEERIEAESLGALAKKIVSTPDLSELLYAHEDYSVHQAPDDLEVEISDVIWSRAFVQAALNGCVPFLSRCGHISVSNVYSFDLNR